MPDMLLFAGALHVGTRGRHLAAEIDVRTHCPSRRAFLGQLAYGAWLAPLTVDAGSPPPDEFASESTCLHSLVTQDPSWRFLGRGGSGVVYAADVEGRPEPLVIKFSYASSAKAVRNEFEVVALLNERGVPSTEEAIRLCQDGPTVAAVYVPEFRGEIGGISDVRDPSAARNAAEQVGATIGAMLAEGIVVVDVQILVNCDSGNVLFLDLTEARALSLPPTPLDLAFCSTFLTESALLLPTSDLLSAARACAREELQRRLASYRHSGATVAVAHPDLAGLIAGSPWELDCAMSAPESPRIRRSH